MSKERINILKANGAKVIITPGDELVREIFKIEDGAACLAALEVAKRLLPNDVLVAITCDTGESYLSTDLFDSE